MQATTESPIHAPKNIDVRELSRLCDNREAEDGSAAPCIIDVRTPAEHGEIHIEGCLLMPLDALDPQKVEDARRSGSPVYLMCRSGKRAGMAAKKLSAAGVEDCVVIEGGVLAWDEAGLPVVRGGKNVMSLERQVRIAAGALVLTGVLLGAFVNPAWLVLAGFVGAGLVFAGITDTCGMGMMLAKMPWNQRSA